jgi:hypothetical protein
MRGTANHRPPVRNFDTPNAAKKKAKTSRNRAMHQTLPTSRTVIGVVTALNAVGVVIIIALGDGRRFLPRCSQRRMTRNTIAVFRRPTIYVHVPGIEIQDRNSPSSSRQRHFTRDPTKTDDAVAFPTNSIKRRPDLLGPTVILRQRISIVRPRLLNCSSIMTLLQPAERTEVAL